MGAEKNDHLKYFSQLDGLRCFAVLAVMIGHLVAWDTDSTLLKDIPWGHGVILFFVLSGYLITNILLELKEDLNQGETSIKSALWRFYTRRFLRIFPAYYFLVFFLFFKDYANTKDIFPWIATHSSNLLQCYTGSYVGSFNHFWSLAVEEQFYLFWPFVILLVKREYLFKTIMGLILFSFLCRNVSFFAFPENGMVSAYFTFNLMLPLGLGALLAYIKRNPGSMNRIFSSELSVPIGLLLYGCFFYLTKVVLDSDYLLRVIDQYAFSIVSAFIVYRASENGFRGPVGFVLNHELVVFIGKISFGLYLYHLFVPDLLWHYLAPTFGLSIHHKHMVWAQYFMISFALALASYYIIEKPAGSLKRFFKY